MTPIKTIHDRRIFYIENLAQIYKNMGYTVRIVRQNKLLEVYEKGTEIPKQTEEIILDKWLN